MLIATGAILSVAPAASAAPAGGEATRGATALTEPAAERVHYYRRSGYCDMLRRACLYKGPLGERGYGNCSRYRAECTDRRYRGYDYRRYDYRGYDRWYGYRSNGTYRRYYRSDRAYPFYREDRRYRYYD